MKQASMAVAATLVAMMSLLSVCGSFAIGEAEAEVTFLAEGRGELVFQRQSVIRFLETQKMESPEATELLARILKECSESSGKLVSADYCPILLNRMLAGVEKYSVRCKDCNSVVPFEAIKGRFADADQNEIEYVDEDNHVLVTIQFEK